jgi:hypothetical protein
MEVMRQVNIFAMMREGYEALFKLADDDAEYVTQRIQDLDDKIRPGLKFGLHIRHGDKHPYEQQYSKGYVPYSKYVITANHELFRVLAPQNGSIDTARMNVSRMVLASDDPAVYDNWGPEDVVRAQDRVILTDGEHDATTPTGIKLLLDWTGGFFQDQFWPLKGNAGWWGTDPTLDSKALLGRSYMLDLAVLSKSDRVVCTVSSIGCRLLAVMMGWQDAILDKKWLNVDGDWDWEGVRW